MKKNQTRNARADESGDKIAKVSLRWIDPTQCNIVCSRICPSSSSVTLSTDDPFTHCMLPQWDFQRVSLLCSEKDVVLKWTGTSKETLESRGSTSTMSQTPSLYQTSPGLLTRLQWASRKNWLSFVGCVVSITSTSRTLLSLSVPVRYLHETNADLARKQTCAYYQF